MTYIPVIEGPVLWCSCETRMSATDPPGKCPSCERNVRALLIEAGYNATVTAWMEAQPLEFMVPELGESKADWWKRVCAAYEAQK